MKICPNCGSEDIKKDNRDWLGFLGGGSTYTCRECGYKGKIFLEIEPERLEDAKETLKEKDIPNFEDREEPFNKMKFFTGLLFLFLGIPLLVYSPLGTNFLIGAVSAFVGLGLLHKEISKLNVYSK